MTSPNQQYEDGLFLTVSDALRFAFSVREKPLLQRQRFGDIAAVSPAQSVMTPHDWHAQGVLIIEAVHRTLAPVQAAFIVAHYAREQHMRANAIIEVATELRDLHKNIMLVYLLTKRYFSLGRRQRQSTREIAAAVKLSRRTVTDLEASVNRVLSTVSERCEARLGEYFTTIGVVGR